MQVRRHQPRELYELALALDGFSACRQHHRWDLNARLRGGFLADSGLVARSEQTLLFVTLHLINAILNLCTGRLLQSNINLTVTRLGVFSGNGTATAQWRNVTPSPRDETRLSSPGHP
jgi:hypothetical protein